MEKLARLGDRGGHVVNTKNGVIETATSNHTCRGAVVALDGDNYRCSIHGLKKLIGTSHYTCDGKKVVRIGDRTTCGATIMEGADGTSFN